jgi:CRISPR system Cascade subunit CasE
LASIAPILLPADGSSRVGHAHRLVWMLFQDIPDVARDFLWRDEGDGAFMLLSQRPPTDPHGLFDLDTKPFQPHLVAGNRLRFALRANPTMTTKRAGLSARDPRRGKRVDVVMDALKLVPETDWDSRAGRAFERDRLVLETVTQWMMRQGERAGFDVVIGVDNDQFGLDEEPSASRPMIRATNYTQVQIERNGAMGRRPAGISIVDITGEVVVTDPARFIEKLARGFGAAKAFGCGLMLIRRAI